MNPDCVLTIVLWLLGAGINLVALQNVTSVKYAFSYVRKTIDTSIIIETHTTSSKLFCTALCSGLGSTCFASIYYVPETGICHCNGQQDRAPENSQSTLVHYGAILTNTKYPCSTCSNVNYICDYCNCMVQGCANEFDLLTGLSTLRFYSSTYKPNGGDLWAPFRARLDSSMAWAKKQGDNSPRLWISFPYLKYITGVVTQGLGNEWVASYRLSVRVNYEPSQDISINGVTLLPGNVDGSSYATHTFSVVPAHTIYFEPANYYGWVTMRVEVKGC